MADASEAAFLSYASQDPEAAGVPLSAARDTRGAGGRAGGRKSGFGRVQGDGSDLGGPAAPRAANCRPKPILPRAERTAHLWRNAEWLGRLLHRFKS